MSMVVVSHVSKRYKRGLGIATLKGLFSGELRHAQYFYALKDVTFQVGSGEVLGIIGQNGSGKTTLLSILLGPVYPSSGIIQLNAPVCSMLDLGIGFENNYTGRQNIHQSLQLQGLTKRDVEAVMGNVVEFSECQSIVDTPFKRWSMGERVRLEFAVLTQLRAPIVLIDDILAFVDVQFKKKALAYMGKVVRSGRTVLIVSHTPETLGELAHRVLWLRHGEIAELGKPDAVIQHYLEECG